MRTRLRVGSINSRPNFCGGTCMWTSKVFRVAATACLFFLLVPGVTLAQQYHRTDLTVDMSSVSSSAPNQDSNLVNAWGISRGAGSPWWISDNGTGLATLYNAAEIGRAHV